MLRKTLNVISTILLVVMIAVVVVIFATRLSGNTPNLFGYQVFRVLSDSMTPTLEVGDVILVKDCEPADIRNGDIITYIGTEGGYKGKTITHRVVEEPTQRDGIYCYHTKGDKTGATVDPEITFEQVKGKYVKTLPLLNKVYSFFLSPAGLIVFIAVIVVLFGYEMISLVVSYKGIDEKDDDYYAPPNRKPKKKRKK